MTRKRFVKLCMARGYSRNEAQELALDARQKGRSYAEAMGIMDASRVVLPQITEYIAGAIAEIGRVAAAAAEGFAAALEAFSAEFNRAMGRFYD